VRPHDRLFAQGLQPRGPLELDLGDRIGILVREGIALEGIVPSAPTPVLKSVNRNWPDTPSW
jgi:hypothetical protein